MTGAAVKTVYRTLRISAAACFMECGVIFPSLHNGNYTLNGVLSALCFYCAIKIITSMSVVDRIDLEPMEDK